ncbi:MAG: tRNA glutamyl-Q(34) synthetase GluQRS [Betaproteobacteria bacterium]|nr:tRNA glutamyl-Q(34) synthetase GluQRS [Betaproteobacteria bacterium]
MEHCRGRFAPSPTGPLHFGSLIAAVGSYLEARSRGGEWLVRVEDLDPPRVVPGAVGDILRALDACGMHWDGQVIYQSARSDAYHTALHELRQRSLIYPCACSRREIADSAVTGVDGFVYPGTCRAGLPAGKTARALRVNTRNAAIGFVDALQGRIRQDLETDVGDFIIYRADRVFAYQLAVVVDDAEQGITDVVRGADLLDSTPRQIYLQRLLGFATPRYAHLPVAVNAEGEKLSKQTFAPAIDPRRPVPQLVAALRFLGQEIPPALEQADVRSLWDWALGNWNLARVPRARSLGEFSVEGVTGDR